MFGQEILEASAIGAATLSILCLSCFLIGVELTTILAATIALSIVLNHTPSHDQEQETSRRVLRHSRSLPQRLVPIVVPDSPEYIQHRRRKPSRHLEAVQRSLSFEGEQ